MGEKSLVVSNLQFLVLLFAVALAAPVAAGGDKIDPAQCFKEAQAVLAQTDSYTAIFHRRERINGKLREEETAFFKFKKPFKLYMKWGKEPSKGLEVLYIEGWNNNRVKVHGDGIIGITTLNLDPKSPLAMKDNRHPVTDSGLENLMNFINENVQRGIKTSEVIFKTPCEEIIYGRKTVKIEGIFPKDKTKGYYCHRAIINFDLEQKVPIKVQIFDFGNNLIESYGYEDLRLNAGLTEADFDPKNPTYRF